MNHMTIPPSTQITQNNEVWAVGSWVSPKFDLSGRGERDTIKAGELVQITSVVNEGFAPVIRVCGMSKGWLCHAFTYIGPDLGDGWIGWSGGACPAGDLMVEIKCKNGYAATVMASAVSWSWPGYSPDPSLGGDIIAFRPALSPPAEGERCVIVPLSRAPFPTSFLDAVNGYATGGSGRCLEAIQAEGARIEATPTPAPFDWTVVGPKLVEAAFVAGAMSVHEYWTENPGEAPRGDPEFDEAASDYAADAIDAVLAAAQPERK